jgi:hypothetical protein
LQQRDRRLDGCEHLIESGADRRGGARHRDEQNDGESTDERRIDPPRARRNSDARTTGDRSVTIT